MFSESSLEYSNGDSVVGVVRQHLFVSRDQGRSWTVRTVASVDPGQPCADCRADYYIGHSSVDIDATGRIVYTYDGAVTTDGPQRIWVRTSTDHGATWSAPVLVSTPGEHASSPTLETRGDGDVRLVYMQTADDAGADRWNAWYRRSADGGLTWTAPVDISDRTGGAAYQHPDGFEEIYGDYGEIAIDERGRHVRDLGRGVQLRGPRRRLVQRRALTSSRASCSPARQPSRPGRHRTTTRYSSQIADAVTAKSTRVAAAA